MRRLGTPIATVFGVGYAPMAPGTVASAVALPFAWFGLVYSGRVGLLALTVVVSALGTLACDRYAREKGVVDPSECVVDEVAGQWLACLFSPVSLLGFALAFVLFRLFDITKLWPISRAERLPGGVGIMADDLVAGLFAGVLVAGAARLGLV